MASGTVLSGSIRIERGTVDDYRALAHLHYVPGDPVCVAGVWRAVWRERDVGREAHGRSRLVAVAVVCHPVPSSHARDAALGGHVGRYGRRLTWLNANVRTIARVIVHPQFRALGIASRLVRRILTQCDTRYIEAFAMMGRIVPFFQRAGMREVCDGYFLFDRREKGGERRCA